MLLGDPKQFYSFPRSDISDEEIVEQLGIAQPLDTITFKAPQLLALYFGARHRRMILSYDKGMGKTVTYLAIAAAANPEKIVLLCSNNAKLAQRREILRHFPQWKDKYIFVEGSDRAKRAAAWNSDNVVYICNPQTFLADMGVRAKSSGRIAPKWVDSAYYIYDEYHKMLRSRKSKLFELLKKLPMAGLILSSGSAGGKGPQDLWAALHICAPKVFTSYWKYVATYCEVSEGPWGRQILGPRNIEGWRNTIGSYCIHRKKDTKDYPSKTRQPLEYELPTWQMKVHNELKKELFSIVNDDTILMSASTLGATIKLRQFMICPKMFDPNLEYGAALEAIAGDVEDSELKHFVISTPFRDPIPWIEKFFREKGIHVERLMGSDGIDTDEMEKRIKRWTQNGGLMIQTIKYAESYELPAARIMYMLGYEYDPEANSQAEDRIHRDIRVTPHPVDIYYLKGLNTYDEQIIEHMSDSADNNYNLMTRPLSEIFRQ